ncbi:MAG TPA: NYN domain-containing protein [Vicinamibacterales bacterium]|nr:NYN domain-containing protein [Vicinamibacterales bacterium]
MAHQDRLNIAVFIDFDNIEIGVKSTLGEHFDVSVILEAIKERGEVVTKIAYADWTRSGEYSRSLTQHAIRLVQRNMTPGGDKNGADINLALDALEMAFTHQHINAYVIVGGDSDFLSLVEKLKQYDKKVFVVGGRAFTSVILQRNCHEFIAYENLRPRRSQPQQKDGRHQAPAAGVTPIAQAIPIVRRALKILADREVTPQTGLLKSTLLQLDSTFSERNYGASSFLDFAEKLSQAGAVTLKHAGRSVTVELNDGFDESSLPQTPEPPASGDGAPAASAPAAPAPAATESAADGVARARQILQAATGARWPMYVRNVKQILRQAGFDDRVYGFGGIMDVIRACQKDGLLRTERDRRGGLRVFPGQALERSDRSQPSSQAPVLPQPDVEAEAAAYEAGEAGPSPVTTIENQQGELNEAEPSETEQAEYEPVPHAIDTTAELLGRATKRGTRSRREPAAPKKPAAKRASARKPRVKKPAAEEAV